MLVNTTKFIIFFLNVIKSREKSMLLNSKVQVFAKWLLFEGFPTFF